MTKQVSGYLTTDNRFFETKEEADYEEAQTVLLTRLEEQGLSPDLLEKIDLLSDDLLKYIEARTGFLYKYHVVSPKTAPGAKNVKKL